MNPTRCASAAAAAMTLVLQVSCSGCSLPFGQEGPPGEFTVLSYNVQNLFDDVRNGDEYYEFDPSRGEWTTGLFHRKLLAVSEVILHRPRGGADIVVLQEVENANVVETIRDHYLKGAGYRYLSVSDTPGSAIQQACLSRFPIVSTAIHGLSLEEGPRLRPVVECVVDLEGLEMSLLLNHWKSKSGGAEETAEMRVAAASLVRRIAAERSAASGGRELLIIGDLNERADEYQRVGGAYPTALVPVEHYSQEAARRGSIFLTGSPPEADGRLRFFSPWLGSSTAVAGSYVYGGEWESIDHVLLGSSMFDGAGVEYAAFSVVAPDFILNVAGHPMGFSRSSGAGYSDHLPILVELRTE